MEAEAIMVTSDTRRTARHVLICLTLLLVVAIPAAADKGRAGEIKSRPGLTSCTIKFSMKSWSFGYRSGKGEGVISCDNGQTARVKLRLKSGGLTAGKGKIRQATGKFTEVEDISELFGSYVAAGASAGAGKSAEAQAVTKGDISLALSGTGTGVELGFSVGKLKITRK